MTPSTSAHRHTEILYVHPHAPCCRLTAQQAVVVSQTPHSARSQQKSTVHQHPHTLRTTSSPSSITRPNTTCLLSSQSLLAHVMKNWQPLELGPLLACGCTANNWGNVMYVMSIMHRAYECWWSRLGSAACSAGWLVPRMPMCETMRISIASSGSTGVLAAGRLRQPAPAHSFGDGTQHLPHILSSCALARPPPPHRPSTCGPDPVLPAHTLLHTFQVPCNVPWLSGSPSVTTNAPPQTPGRTMDSSPGPVCRPVKFSSAKRDP